ncbi:hypothetical protein GCM10010168_34320 [Actinoplanes ianthinogenes]|uniref:Lipoprotein n=1 Tax=Actinoplanes ianthinogenes TaxID=122358 RepID=A0ABN6CPA5_9ACTN|nr:hypothetical protein [Actinoplanes ianthinogenes]BCJ47048.1 hypothetical protein Aiant_77050 [Actinoplanes ianthinogenes]GGR13656.1 hypothetical protein GCM10010168_34320 [Actinoplanes ianthinogenes]
MRMTALLAVVLAGTASCGRAGPESLPAGPATLVLQVTVSPSSPRPWERGQVPRFSLYGGGRVIVPAGGDDALRSAREYRLSPGAYRDLVDRAYSAGLDRGGEIDNRAETDSSLLTITLSTAGGVRTTRVVAPDDGDDVSEFVRTLPETPADAIAYRPVAVAVLATGGVGSEGTVRPWPLEPLERGTRTEAGLCTVTTTAVPFAGTPQEESRWSSGGKVYAVVGRPLLPAEPGCP